MDTERSPGSAASPVRQTIIRSLADGTFLSGSELAESLGVSRTAVWKHIESLRDLGLEVEAVTGKGYRLVRPLDLLDASLISAELGAAAGARLASLEIHEIIDSTNARLLGAPPPPPGQGRFCISELQTGGRGRRGRSWVAPYAGGLWFSLGWSFDVQPADFHALGLAVGVACARALEAVAGCAIGLKWPNDLIIEDHKLGGILIEMQGEASGPVYTVIGVGINVDLDAEAREAIAATGGLPATDLRSHARRPVQRSVAAIRLGAELLAAAVEFGASGFAPFREAFAARDVLRDHLVTIQGGSQSWDGRCLGVDADGALMLQTDGQSRRFVAGEVSVRPR